MSTRSSSSPRCAPSASPRCAATSAASATRSRRCAPNGRRSRIPRASRGWCAVICRSVRCIPTQFDSLDRLPERAPQIVQPPPDDAIASMIENPDDNAPTGSIPEEGTPPEEDRRQARCQAGRIGTHGRNAQTLPAAVRGEAGRAVAAPADPHAALRPQRRPQRQGAGARRPRHRRLRRGLWRDRGAAGDVRGGAGKPRRAARRFAGAHLDRAPRHPRPQRPDPRDRRALAVAVRRAAPHHRRRRGDRAARPRCCPISTPPNCATGSAPRRASSGSSARSRRKQQREIHRLGLPGVGFLAENKRVYPNAPRSRT